MFFEELLGAARKHAAYVDRLCWQSQAGVVALNHAAQHVGRWVREQRKCARLGRGGGGDAVGGLVVLESDAKNAGRRSHDLVELRPVEGRHIDMLIAFEERLIRL